MMSPGEKEFRMKLIRILLQVDTSINDELNRAIWKIAGVLKQYKNNLTYADVWAGNGHVKHAVDKFIKEYSGQITNLTRQATKSIFQLTEEKNDQILKAQIESMLVGDAGPMVNVSKVYHWFNRVAPEGITPKDKNLLTREFLSKVSNAPRNNTAMEAFLDRQVNGIRLSERVWKLQETNIQPLIESYLVDGVEAGKTASEISQEVRRYLDQPEKLFRRVRSKVDGKLKLSKAAQKYHPGQGVYRSSYKNALRLARNEVNMAYRAADHDRWQQMDFITGIQIELSEQHPTPDICDALAGSYPKDFHFPSWHPQCLCHSTPIMMPKDQFKKYLAGENVKVKETVETPQNFIEWAGNNEARIEDMKNKPLFIELNPKYYQHAVNQKVIHT